MVTRGRYEKVENILLRGSKSLIFAVSSNRYWFATYLT